MIGNPPRCQAKQHTVRASLGVVLAVITSVLSTSLPIPVGAASDRAHPEVRARTFAQLPGGPNDGAIDAALAGTWRVLSARLFYDAGGGGSVRTDGPDLTLGADGTFAYGETIGTWSLGSIADDDWARWQTNPYGPGRKISFAGWQPGGIADGPIEESGGPVDFLWVIFRAEPPLVGAPGMVQMKFGRR